MKGLHFDLEKTREGYEKIGKGIVNLLSKPDFIEMCRGHLDKSDTIMDWKTVANKWIEYF